MSVDTVIAALEAIAPPHLAAEWDNVGLLVGSRQWKAERVLLTIDLTQPVLKEAIEAKANVIVAYHPPIFEPLKSITDATVKQRIVLEAAQRRIAIYSPHSALDSVEGGINDWLAEGLGRGDLRALEATTSLPESEQCKIVTFCPHEAVEQIRNGLASIGAGQIGAYRLCSFELRGTGTFFGGEETSPKVGKRGALQRVEETRLEMVCPRAALALAVMTLKQFHPYEEPPIEVYQLQPRPVRGAGHGRRLTLDQPMSLRTAVERLKRHLGVKHVQVSAAEGGPEKFSRIGFCAGAGRSLLASALAQGCEMFITGELPHHDVLAAQARGCTVVLAGHTNTERGYLKRLKKRLHESLGDAVAITISKRDGDPLRVM